MLTGEQISLKQMISSFCEKEINPYAGNWDEANEFPRNTFDQLCQLGLGGISSDETYDGSYLDYFTRALVFEELSKGCVALAATLSVHNMVAYTILKYGDEAQRKKWLPAINTGKLIAAYALTEPNAGSDAAALETTAVEKDGYFLLNGNKIFITSAEEAGVYLVMAKTEKELGAKGITAFLVEKGAPGFTFGKKEKKMGFGASVTREIIFHDCKIAVENLLGERGSGFSYALNALDYGRINMGALGVGLAQTAFDHALDYAKNRQQFGKPISAFQGIQFMLADLATEIEAARGLVYRAARMMDQHGVPPSAVTLAAAMAKRFATDVAMRVTTDAVQIYGGYGYMKEYPVERYMRAAKVLQIVEGTNQIQRLVIARELLN